MTIVPREPQALAIAKAIPALQKKKRALVVLATALGKTIASALIAKRLKVRKVLFLVHNNFILDKALKEYQKVFGESRTYAIYNGLTKDGALEADFVFASFQTMGGNLDNWRRKHFDLVVVDESHHAQANTYRPVIEYFLAMRLGITATPNRADLLDIRKLFGKEVINISLEEAIARGWLPRIEYHVVTDDGFDEEALARLTQEVLKEGKRISMEEINRRVFVTARDEKISEIIEGYDEKTLIFCRNVAHAENFRPYLKSSRVFHSKTGRHAKDTWNQNKETLDDLGNGLILRVLAVNAFNEGVDVPSIGLVVFLRTTDSETIFLQQLGRGCRLGKEKLVVLDFVGNVERIMRLKEMRDRIARHHEQHTNPRGRAEEGYEDNLLLLSGKGFEFTFSAKLVDLMKIIERVQTESCSTWESAAKIARRLGIKTSGEYRKKYRADPRLPSTPHRMPDFPGWSAFLATGKTKRRSCFYSTCEEASRAAQTLGIRNSKEYNRRYKEDKMLPAAPREKYSDFPGWDVFLAIEERRPRWQKPKYATCQQASVAARKLAISSKKEYSEKYKCDKLLPSVPDKVYPDFPGWDVFLGRKPPRETHVVFRALFFGINTKEFLGVNTYCY